MAATHRVSISLNRGAGANLTRQSTVAGEEERYYPELSCADDATTEIAFAEEIANIKELLIYANGTLLLRTNDGTTGDDEFALTATNYLYWSDQNLAPNPITANITALFAVVAEGDGPVKLTILALVDATP